MCAKKENPEDRLHALFERCRQGQVGVVPFMSREIRTHLNGVLCALQVIEQQGTAALPDDVPVYQACTSRPSVCSARWICC